MRHFIKHFVSKVSIILKMCFFCHHSKPHYTLTSFKHQLKQLHSIINYLQYHQNFNSNINPNHMQTAIFFYKKNLHKLTLWLKMSHDTYLWLNRDDALDFPQKSKLKDLDGLEVFFINWRKLENWVSVSVYVHRTSGVNCSRFYISSAVNCREVLSYFTCVSQPN